MNRLIAFSDTPTVEWIFATAHVAQSTAGMDRTYWRGSPGIVVHVGPRMEFGDLWEPTTRWLLGRPLVEDPALPPGRLELRYSSLPPWWQRTLWRAVACTADAGRRVLTTVADEARTRQRGLP